MRLWLPIMACPHIGCVEKHIGSSAKVSCVVVLLVQSRARLRHLYVVGARAPRLGSSQRNFRRCQRPIVLFIERSCTLPRFLVLASYPDENGNADANFVHPGTRRTGRGSRSSSESSLSSSFSRRRHPSRYSHAPATGPHPSSSAQAARRRPCWRRSRVAWSMPGSSCRCTMRRLRRAR